MDIETIMHILRTFYDDSDGLCLNVETIEDVRGLVKACVGWLRASNLDRKMEFEETINFYVNNPTACGIIRGVGSLVTLSRKIYKLVEQHKPKATTSKFGVCPQPGTGKFKLKCYTEEDCVEKGGGGFLNAHSDCTYRNEDEKNGCRQQCMSKLRRRVICNGKESTVGDCLVEDKNKWWQILKPDYLKSPHMRRRVKKMRKQMTLIPSPKQSKKWRVVFGDGTRTDFGQKGASDYTIHKDISRRNRYIQRHRKDLRGNPTKAWYLSMFVLWNKPTLTQSWNDYVKRFRIFQKTGTFPIHI